MKTTIEMDRELLEQAKKVLGTATIKGTIDESLKAVVRQRRLQALADALGTIPLDLTSDQLRHQRKKRTTRVSR
ncbi:MAG: hypothetical protein NPIRA02_18970 [Nitrospirales bacterium]|nr:MAG: hypothetical protein NPIRA02_18970 [Nitrospirales bacterium]